MTNPSLSSLLYDKHFNYNDGRFCEEGNASSQSNNDYLGGDTFGVNNKVDRMNDDSNTNRSTSGMTSNANNNSVIYDDVPLNFNDVDPLYGGVAPDSQNQGNQYNFHHSSDDGQNQWRHGDDANDHSQIMLCASCDRCRARKTKCDGMKPCGNCVNRYKKANKLIR